MTGIYDYALMQSVFTPVNQTQHPQTLRVTTANIEWCGQFLTSTRLTDAGYSVQYQSYFDGEEDTRLDLPYAILEDEIWNWIRISPENLPIGKQPMIPGILTQELTHHELKVEMADCQLVQTDSLSTYTLDYPTIDRTLEIVFESDCPHRIVSWAETFETVSGWGIEAKLMTTRASRIGLARTDYWEKKYLRHESMRKDSLGIQDCPPTLLP